MNCCQEIIQVDNLRFDSCFLGRRKKEKQRFCPFQGELGIFSSSEPYFCCNLKVAVDPFERLARLLHNKTYNYYNYDY